MLHNMLYILLCSLSPTPSLLGVTTCMIISPSSALFERPRPPRKIRQTLLSNFLTCSITCLTFAYTNSTACLAHTYECAWDCWKAGRNVPTTNKDSFRGFIWALGPGPFIWARARAYGGGESQAPLRKAPGPHTRKGKVMGEFA